MRLVIGAVTAHTAEAITRGWRTRSLPVWGEWHGMDVLDSLEADMFPILGQRPIDNVTAPMVLGVLCQIKGGPALETARRCRANRGGGPTRQTPRPLRLPRPRLQLQARRFAAV